MMAEATTPTVLWHGTAAQLEPTIRRGGLEAPPNSRLLFAHSEEVAAEMAAAVVSWLLEAGDLEDKRGLILKVELPAGVQIALINAVPSAWITHFAHRTYPDLEGVDHGQN